MSRKEGESPQASGVEKLYEEADRILAEASSPDALQGNPYKGKPLRLGDEVHQPDYWGHRMLKNAGHTLPWIALEREIDQALADLNEWARAEAGWLERERADLALLRGERFMARRAWILRRHEQYVERTRSALAGLRRDLVRFNLEVPIAGRQRRVIDPEGRFTELRRAWAPALERLRAAEPAPPSPRRRWWAAARRIFTIFKSRA